MKTKKRIDTFETNSSSVHSLCIKNIHTDPCDIPRTDDNKLIVQLRYFGKDDHTYETQEEKLSYLITWLYCKYGYYQDNDLSEYDEWSMGILDSILEYANADGFEIHYPEKGDFGFDHQSDPSMYDCIMDIYNEDNLLMEIFSKNYFIKTTCD